MKLNNIIKEIEGALSVLDTVDVPFSYIKKYKDSDTYVTYFIVNTTPTGYSDNDYKCYMYDIQVDVWSAYEADNTEFIDMIIDSMKSKGFNLTRLGSDMYESETDILHKAIEFSYLLKIERE